MADNRFNFTKAALEALTPPSRGLLFVYDTAVPGLALCITPNDSRTYYRCGRIGGRYQRVKIGDYHRFKIAQARAAATRISADVAEGKGASVGNRTLADLHSWYMTHHSRPHKRTANRDESHFYLHLERLAKRRISTLTRQEIQSLITEIAGRVGKGAANNALVLLRGMLSKAVENGWIASNPTAGIPRYARNQRERFLQGDELQRFFAALEQLSRETTRDFFRLALYTGARRQNVLSMRWDDIHLELGIWLIPATRQKSKRAQGVPLSPSAMDVLRRRFASRNPDCQWVFPGQSRAGHLNDPKAAWKRILEISGLKDVVIHDLRRTLGSWQAATGASLPIIGKTLGHQSPSATQIYARLDLEPVRAAIEKATTAMLDAAAKSEQKNS